MNCRDINNLLDANSADKTTFTQSDAIRQHLASCPACSDEWEIWQRIAALQIPGTPPELRSRIVAILPDRGIARTRRLGRPFLVGGALIAGFSLAALAAWQVAHHDRPSEATLAGSAAATESLYDTSQAASLPVVNATLSPESSALSAPGTGGGRALDPLTIVVIKRPEAAADARAIALADRCHDAIIAEFRSLGGLNIITHASAFTTASFEEQVELSQRDQSIARGLGAEHVLVVATMNGCRATLFDSQTRKIVNGAGGGGVDPDGDRLYSFSKFIAQSVHERFLPDPGMGAVLARFIVFNTSLSDRAREKALQYLIEGKRGRDGPPFDDAPRILLDKELLAAAVDLGTTSQDVRVREHVWVMLRDVADPSLVQPLLQALANDPDKTVRMQVAYTVRKFLDVPGVKAALLKAAAEDPDSQPPAEGCCLETVREAAERASVANSDFRAWVRRKLLDENLPTRSRLWALRPGSMDGRFVYEISSIGQDAGGIVFSIGKREQEPYLRALAWNILERAKPDKDFIAVLLGDLRNHQDSNVRATAARVLTRHLDNAEVRQALDRALKDPSMEVRRVATTVSRVADRMQ
jgi:hypothetical protein